VSDEDNVTDATSAVRDDDQLEAVYTNRKEDGANRR
jgi:hypothetical protein